MRMNKFTTLFQTALADAQSLAVGRDHQYIEPVHVLKTLAEQDQGTITPLLQQAGVNLSKLLDSVDKAIDRLPQVQGTPGEVHISRELSQILALMDKYAQKNKDHYIASELFVPAALEAKGVLGPIFQNPGREGPRLLLPPPQNACP